MLEHRLADSPDRIRIEHGKWRAASVVCLEALPAAQAHRIDPMAADDDDPGSDGDPPDGDLPDGLDDERRSIGFIMV
jgi:hypothetical protein